MQPDNDSWARFAATHWSLVLAAGTPPNPAADAALGRLCEIYWPPLYAFLRRQGFPREDCEDLVQGCLDRLIARDFLKDVSQDKGRFRSFLLAALRHHVANAQRDARTQRRGGRVIRLSLEEPGILENCETAAAALAAPDLVYDRLWAETLMENATRALRAEYTATGRADLYQQLCAWLAREPAPGEYAAAAPAAGLTEGGLAAAVFRLRRRFRELIRAAVAQTVQTPAEIGPEMHHLFRILTE